MYCDFSRRSLLESFCGAVTCCGGAACSFEVQRYLTLRQLPSWGGELCVSERLLWRGFSGAQGRLRGDDVSQFCYFVGP